LGEFQQPSLENTPKALNSLGAGLMNPMKVLGTLQKHIPERLLQSHFAENST
jgi:hypothetical protein